MPTKHFNGQELCPHGEAAAVGGWLTPAPVSHARQLVTVSPADPRAMPRSTVSRKQRGLRGPRRSRTPRGHSWPPALSPAAQWDDSFPSSLGSQRFVHTENTSCVKVIEEGRGGQGREAAWLPASVN